MPNFRAITQKKQHQKVDRSLLIYKHAKYPDDTGLHVNIYVLTRIHRVNSIKNDCINIIIEQFLLKTKKPIRIRFVFPVL